MSENPSLLNWLSKLGIAKELNNYDIIGGITVNSVLSKIVTGYALKMTSTNTAATRINNWNNLMYQTITIQILITENKHHSDPTVEIKDFKRG